MRRGCLWQQKRFIEEPGDILKVNLPAIQNIKIATFKIWPHSLTLFNMKKTFGYYTVISILLLGCSKDVSSVSSSTTTTTTTSSSSTTYYYQSGSTVTQASETYYSTIADTGAVEVTGAGTYTLTNSKLWSSGSTTSTDSSSFYGLNACALATDGATLTLSNDSINTTGISGNGVYSYGASTVTLNTDTINTTGSGGHAIYAAGGGTLTATSVIAVTNGGSSSAIATDRGGGTITVSGGNYTTNGSISADVYSTGVISCSGAILTSNGAEAVVVEGSNSATLTNCTTKCTFSKWGALIYQSVSGDASGTTGTLTITGGSFTYTGLVGGLFYNTNDSAYIYLNGVAITNSCDTLVRSLEGSWGQSTTATSPGNTYLICSGQTISGIIYADANSMVTLKLTSSSSYTGKVNPGDVAAAASVVMDASSTWVLTGNTYLTSLTDAVTSYSNITPSGYHLYVNGTQVL